MKCLYRIWLSKEKILECKHSRDAHGFFYWITKLYLQYSSLERFESFGKDLEDPTNLSHQKVLVLEGLKILKILFAPTNHTESVSSASVSLHSLSFALTLDKSTSPLKTFTFASAKRCGRFEKDLEDQKWICPRRKFWRDWKPSKSSLLQQATWSSSSASISLGSRSATPTRSEPSSATCRGFVQCVLLHHLL